MPVSCSLRVPATAASATESTIRFTAGKNSIPARRRSAQKVAARLGEDRAVDREFREFHLVRLPNRSPLPFIFISTEPLEWTAIWNPGRGIPTVGIASG